MYIQKILAYDVYANTIDTDRYKRVSKLLNQTVDPETLLPHALDCHHKNVRTSSLKRAVSCIKQDSATSVSKHLALNEIAFSLQEFCTEEHFITNGSTAVREAFVQAFVADRLHTSHKQLQEELESVLALRNQTNAPLCISHTFRMKLLEIYAAIGGTLFQDPTSINDYIDCKKHLYTFGQIIEI